MSKTYSIKQNEKTILSITIDPPTGTNYTNLQWDSKTGLVTAIVDGKRKPIPYTGKSYGTINPGAFTAENLSNISFHYWYY